MSKLLTEKHGICEIIVNPAERSYKGNLSWKAAMAVTEHGDTKVIRFGADEYFAKRAACQNAQKRDRDIMSLVVNSTSVRNIIEEYGWDFRPIHIYLYTPQSHAMYTSDKYPIVTWDKDITASVVPGSPNTPALADIYRGWVLDFLDEFSASGQGAYPYSFDDIFECIPIKDKAKMYNDFHLKSLGEM